MDHPDHGLVKLGGFDPVRETLCDFLERENLQ